MRGLNFEVFEECVESDEEFPGDGDEGDVVGFVIRAKFLEEGREVGAVSGGGFGGHVQGFADDFSTSIDASFSDPGAGLLRVGGKARDGGSGLAGEGSQFGKVSQENRCSLGADARGSLQSRGLGSEVGFLGDEFMDLLIELLNEPRQLLNAAFDFGGDEPIGTAAEAVFLAGAILDELGAAVGKSSQATSRGRGLLRGFRGGGFAETGDDGGIDGVGLGEDFEALGKVPNTARLHDRDGDASIVKSVGQDPLVPSRGFEDDMRLVVLGEQFDQSLNPFVRVGQHAK